MRLRHLNAGTLLGLIAVVLSAGGIAYATIPDTSGVIHGCYDNQSGALRVIDPSTNQSCAAFQTPLDWNQQGPAGAQGAPGVQGPPGPPGSGGGGVASDTFVFSDERELSVSGHTQAWHLPLAAGSYTVSADAVADNTGAVNGGLLICTLDLASGAVPFDISDAAFPSGHSDTMLSDLPPETGGSAVTVHGAVAGTLSSAGGAVLQCGGWPYRSTTPLPISLSNVRIVATRVSSVTATTGTAVIESARPSLRRGIRISGLSTRDAGALTRGLKTGAVRR